MCRGVGETCVLRSNAIRRGRMGGAERMGKKRKRREKKKECAHYFSVSDSIAICKGIGLLTVSKET